MAAWTIAQHERELLESGDLEGCIGTVSTPVDTWYPENLKLHWELDGGIEVGSANWELPRVRVVAPGVEVPYPVPPQGKLHDFYVKRDGTDLMGGEIDDVYQAALEDEFFAVSGSDWMQHLGGRTWPYDPELSYKLWPDGFRFAVRTGEVLDIVKDLLETVRDLSTNYPTRCTADAPSYCLDFTVDVDDTGHNIEFHLDAFDSSDLLTIARGLAQQARGQGGFEAYMTTDKVFKGVYPEIGSSDDPIYTILATQLVDLSYRDAGPDATHILGSGAGGASSQQGGVNKHFRANSAQYRRIDERHDFGNVRGLTQLENLTIQELDFAAQPTKDLTLQLDPQAVSGFWSSTRCGKVIYVGPIDLGWHVVDAPYKIVSIDAEVDAEQNELVTLGLNRYYDTVGSGGLADW